MSDKPSIHIDFDTFLHEYKINGKKVPGVTSTINCIPDDLLYNSNFRRKGEIGTATHTLAHELKTFKKIKSKKLLTSDVTPYFDGYVKFTKESGFKNLMSEVRVGSRVWGYGGTIDDLALSPRGKLALLDIKVSAVPSPTTALQTAAYAAAVDEMIKYKVEPLVSALVDVAGEKVRERWCIWLTGDGKYKLIQYKNKSDINVFLGALAFRNWKIKNGLD